MSRGQPTHLNPPNMRVPPSAISPHVHVGVAQVEEVREGNFVFKLESGELIVMSANKVWQVHPRHHVLRACFAV
eukprot:2839706-Pleurochrysis_carterae.AAC.1